MEIRKSVRKLIYRSVFVDRVLALKGSIVTNDEDFNKIVIWASRIRNEE